MINIKDHKTAYMFDPFEHLGPKRLKALKQSWAGLFREYILPELPAQKLARYFPSRTGHPTKELYAMTGALILQNMFDYTDEETVDAFAFNIQWHYALDITSDSDAAAYVSLKTLWNTRQRIANLELQDEIFEKVTATLVEKFKVNTGNQRLDSMHISSNMRHLGRIGLFVQTIRKFLVNLKRHHSDQFRKLPAEAVDKYLDRKQENAFSMVKPSESHNTLKQLAEDLFMLVERFKADEAVNGMSSYHLLVRLLKEQCIVSRPKGGRKRKIEVSPKANRDVAASSLQNPSDPDAGYDAHKGKGYQVQLAETYSQKKDKDDDRPLSLITYAKAEPAHKSDAKALEPMLDYVEEAGRTPETLLADTLYGSDHNVESAKERGVELIAPTGSELRTEGEANLDQFEFADNNKVKRCPAGHAPQKIHHKAGTERISACFVHEHCESCDKRDECITKPGGKGRYLRFRYKDVRFMRRRARETTAEFHEEYRLRAGIEATNSEFARKTGVKRLRFRGLRNVSFCVKLKAAGLNIKRAAAYRRKKGWETPPCGPLAWLLTALLIVKEPFPRLKQEILRNPAFPGAAVFFQPEFVC
jgi:hypothetical protein